MAYEHLVNKNEIYRQGPVHECGCGYVAETLSGLERHRRSGFTKDDGGRGAFSYNRMICCCYCTDRVPYTVAEFSRHMIYMHHVKPRVIFPVLNPCPFCSYSGQSDSKTFVHILKCRALFKPNLNLFYPACVYDLPLLPTVRFPAYRPQNVTHAVSVLRGAVSNSAIHTASSSVVFAPLNSPRLVATTLAPAQPAVTIARWHAVGGTHFSASGVNLLPCQTSLGNPVLCIPNGIEQLNVPITGPVVPVQIYSNRFTAPFPSMLSTPCVLPVQNRSIYSSGVYPDPAVNFCRSAFSLPSQQLLSLSAQQQISDVVSQVFSTAVAKNTVPSTATRDTVASSSSLGDFRVQTEGPQAEVTSGISKKGCRKKVDKGSIKMAPHSRSESVPRSSVSRVLSKNANGRVSSAQLPVVVLRRLTVSVCEVCGLVFEKPVFMCHHLLKAHSISVTENDCLPGSPCKTQQCDCCSLRFFSMKGLSRHMQIVHEQSVGGHSCPRCSETGISDLIKHFRVKHDVTPRTMVDYRICYLCKLNFTTAADVERHAISVHADIFPSSSHFRQAVRASVCGITSTNTQSERNPSVNNQKNSRKRRHSVIEIDLDSSDSMKERSTNQKCKEQSSDVVGKTGTSSGKEPVTKKARKSGHVSTDAINCMTPVVNTDQSQVLSAKDKVCEEHSATALEKDAILGAVSQATKSVPDVSVRLTALKSSHKTDSSVLLPTDKRTVSSVNVSDKSASMPDVSVRLTALNSVKTGSSVLSPTEKTKGSSVNVSDKSASMPDVSVRLTALESLHKTDSSVLPPTEKRTGSSINAGIPDGSVRLIPLKSVHKTDSSVVSLRRESTITSDNTTCKSAGLPEVSVNIPPSSSSHGEDTSAKKDKGRYRFV